jgi:protein-disulfide isomerase
MDGSNKSFFDAIPSKTAFTLGFITAVLSLGTLGFVVLGNCVLSGDCSGIQAAEADTAKTTTTTKTAAVAPTDTTVTGKVPVVDEKDHVRGDEKATLTIIEYSDFQCPYCSRFHPTMQQIMEDYDGQVKWVYRHFPLSFHPNAMPAAEATECASEQGKFWEFADTLFANQDKLSDDDYQQIAKDLGLDLTKFNDCLSSDRTLAIINADAQEGAAAGVTGTPGSFLIDADGNAQSIKGALPYASVKAMIDAALE